MESLEENINLPDPEDDELLDDDSSERYYIPKTGASGNPRFDIEGFGELRDDTLPANLSPSKPKREKRDTPE